MEDIASREDVRTMNWSVQKSVLVKEAERIGFERFQVGYVDERGGHAVGDVISTTGDTANAGDRAFFKQRRQMALKRSLLMRDMMNWRQWSGR